MSIYTDIILPTGWLLCVQIPGTDILNPVSAGYSMFYIATVYSTCNDYSFFDMVMAKTSDTIQVRISGSIFYLVKEENVVAKREFIFL